MNNKQIEIIKGIAVAYDKLKLVLTQPVAIMTTTRENLNI